MTDKMADKIRAEMRRKEKQVTELSKILEIINKCQVLRIGLVENNKAYIVPVNFGWQVKGDQINFFFHSAKVGRKVGLMSTNPECSFEMDQGGSIVKAATACKWSASFQSVMGEGLVTKVIDPAEKAQAMDFIMARYGFAGKPTYNETTFANTLLYKIEVQSIIGKIG